MRRLCLAFAISVGVYDPSLAQAILAASSAQESVAQGLLCRSAVDAAERASGIPAHLLAAISRVESGRRDPATGAVHPWPWSVNAEGQGVFTIPRPRQWPRSAPCRKSGSDQSTSAAGRST